MTSKGHPTLEEDYLRNEIMKPYRQQIYEKLREIIDRLTRSCNPDASNNTEMKRKDTETETEKLKDMEMQFQRKAVQTQS